MPNAALGNPGASPVVAPYIPKNLLPKVQKPAVNPPQVIKPQAPVFYDPNKPVTTTPVVTKTTVEVPEPLAPLPTLTQNLFTGEHYTVLQQKRAAEKAEATQSYTAEIYNPNQINSFFDLVTRTIDGISTAFSNKNIWTDKDEQYAFLRQQWNNTNEYLSYFYKPIYHKQYDIAARNVLIGLGETGDVLKNVVVSLFDPKNTSAKNYDEEIIESAWTRLKSSIGITEGHLRYTYDWDTGNGLLDLVLELVSDPLNLISLGSKIAAKSAFKTATEPITEVLSKLDGSDKIFKKTLSKQFIAGDKDAFKTGIQRFWRVIGNKYDADTLAKAGIDKVTANKFNVALMNVFKFTEDVTDIKAELNIIDSIDPKQLKKAVQYVKIYQTSESIQSLLAALGGINGPTEMFLGAKHTFKSPAVKKLFRSIFTREAASNVYGMDITKFAEAARTAKQTEVKFALAGVQDIPENASKIITYAKGGESVNVQISAFKVIEDKIFDFVATQGRKITDLDALNNILETLNKAISDATGGALSTVADYSNAIKTLLKQYPDFEAYLGNYNESLQFLDSITKVIDNTAASYRFETLFSDIATSDSDYAPLLNVSQKGKSKIPFLHDMGPYFKYSYALEDGIDNIQNSVSSTITKIKQASDAAADYKGIPKYIPDEVFTSDMELLNGVFDEIKKNISAFKSPKNEKALKDAFSKTLSSLDSKYSGLYDTLANIYTKQSNAAGLLKEVNDILQAWKYSPQNIMDTLKKIFNKYGMSMGSDGVAITKETKKIFKNIQKSIDVNLQKTVKDNSVQEVYDYILDVSQFASENFDPNSFKAYYDGLVSAISEKIGALDGISGSIGINNFADMYPEHYQLRNDLRAVYNTMIENDPFKIVFVKPHSADTPLAQIRVNRAYQTDRFIYGETTNKLMDLLNPESEIYQAFFAPDVVDDIYKQYPQLVSDQTQLVDMAEYIQTIRESNELALKTLAPNGAMYYYTFMDTLESFAQNASVKLKDESMRWAFVKKMNETLNYDMVKQSIRLDTFRDRLLSGKDNAELLQSIKDMVSSEADIPALTDILLKGHDAQYDSIFVECVVRAYLPDLAKELDDWSATILILKYFCGISKLTHLILKLLTVCRSNTVVITGVLLNRTDSME